MKIQVAGKTAHLTYCTNVHPSDDLNQIHEFLSHSVIPLKKSLSCEEGFGLGLYLPASVVGELSENERRLWDLDEFLDQNRLYVFTLNCFPFGNFHEERVKEKAFEPDWTSPERLDFTNKAADLLARWLPSGVRGSISTHTGAYGQRQPGDPVWSKISENFARAAFYLHQLEEKTGKQIVLSLEPEPFSIVDTTQGFIKFFKEHLLRNGGGFLKRSWGISPEVQEALLRRHVGICFDTCHLCVEYEDLPDSIDRLLHHGISIGKAQLSVAIQLSNPGRNPKGLARLRSFVEPRYFHQAILSLDSPEAKGRDREGKKVDVTVAFPDLPQALQSQELPEAGSLRSHFHVPIFWQGDSELGTTQGDLIEALPKLAAATDHLEIETYTWDVIPEIERKRAVPDLISSIENEYLWVLRQFSGK